MSAIRVARGFTDRPTVVKFAGNYHGHGDLLLAEAGSGLAALGLPGSAGVTDAAVQDTRVVPYNVVPELDERTACVIVEPIAANMGLVPPDPGFLAGLRAECDRVGALLVFDEVITGFRVARGGAQELFGVAPDLTHHGQGHRRRAQHRRLRRPRRRDGGGGAARSRVPGRHPVGEPAGHGRRAGRARPARRDGLRHPARPGRGAGRGAAPGARRRGHRGARPRGLDAGGPLPGRPAAVRLRRGAGHRRGALRQAVPRPARPGRGHGAGRLRGHVPGPRPHRRRAGRGRGRGHREPRSPPRSAGTSPARRLRRGQARGWARGCRPTPPSRDAVDRACTGPGSGCRSAANPR